MEIDRTTIPGSGVLHTCRSRAGHRFGVLAGTRADRQLIVFDPTGDTPLRVIELETDEADEVAEILHSRPVLDRIADLERRMSELAKAGSRG